MSKLDAKERKALPKKEFAGPDRSYPVNDENHARDALARASEMRNKGKLSEGQYSHIVSMAHAVLKKDKLGQAAHAAAHKHGVKKW